MVAHTSLPPLQLKNKLINSVLHLLKFRPRSEQEIRRYLANHGASSSIIDEIIDYFKNDLKLIDDSGLALQYANSLLNSKQKSNKLISYKLRQLGISSGDINTALNQLSDSDQKDSAKKLLQKKSTKFISLPTFQAKAKASQLLYSRGFSSQIIRAVIDDFFSPR